MVQTSKSSEIITEPMSRYALARSASEHAGQVTHPGTAVPKFSTPAKLHQDGLAITTSEFPSSLISPEQPSQPMEPFNPRITAFGNSGINGQALRQEKTILVPFQTQPDSTMSSDETFQSCSNESSPWTYMSHETPNTGDLNFHRNVLILGTPPDPTSLPLDDLEAELAFFDMDLFGIGEQFAGYD